MLYGIEYPVKKENVMMEFFSSERTGILPINLCCISAMNSGTVIIALKFLKIREKRGSWRV